VSYTLADSFVGGQRSDLLRLCKLPHRELNLSNMAVVMGANVAGDVAADHYAEATVGCKDPQAAAVVSRIFDSPVFHTDTTTDVASVEFCGALKNVVAIGAGTTVLPRDMQRC
jgi:glycerol-3-phosphate dehydrogenase (NAD+)